MRRVLLYVPAGIDGTFAHRAVQCLTSTSACRTPVSNSSMPISLRRLAAFILLLTVPLRVYAAAAMVFCGPGSDPEAVQSVTPMHHETHASTHGHHIDIEHFLAVHEASTVESHHLAGADAASFDDHLSCGGCCCSGMIATANVDWKPQMFSTPTMPVFVAIAVPSTVPQRLERPPRSVLG